MIIEVIIKTSKGKKSKEYKIDRTCDEVMRIGLRLGSKIVGGVIFLRMGAVWFWRKDNIFYKIVFISIGFISKKIA